MRRSEIGATHCGTAIYPVSLDLDFSIRIRRQSRCVIALGAELPSLRPALPAESLIAPRLL